MPDIQAVLAANEKLSQEVLRASGDSIDQSRRFPRENLHALGKSGVLGLLIPAQYEGTGAGLAEMSHVLDVQAQSCASTAMVTLMHFCATAMIAAKRKYEHAGGAALASIPRVQFLVAEITLAVNSGEAYLRETIRKALAADPAAMLDVLGVKVVAADACLAAVSRAMTLGGGWAFGRRGGIERIFRDAQAAAVMAPSSDVLKDFIGKASLGLPLF